MVNYLQRVAAAGARVASWVPPAFAAPPRLPTLLLPPLANFEPESSSTEGLIGTLATTPHPAISPLSASPGYPSDQPAADVTTAQELELKADHQDNVPPDTPGPPLSLSSAKPITTPPSVEAPCEVHRPPRRSPSTDTLAPAPGIVHEARSAPKPVMQAESPDLAADVPIKVIDPARDRAPEPTPTRAIEPAPRALTHLASGVPVTLPAVNQAAKVGSQPVTSATVTPIPAATSIMGLERPRAALVVKPKPASSGTKEVHRLSVAPQEIASSDEPLSSVSFLSNIESSTTLIVQSAPPNAGHGAHQIPPNQPPRMQRASIAVGVPPSPSDLTPRRNASGQQPTASPHDTSVPQGAPQTREALNSRRPAANPTAVAARPAHDHTAMLPLPTATPGRKNGVRIAIGRIEVQVNNHPQSVAPPRLKSLPAPQQIDLDSRFLSRFVIRP